MLNLPSLTLAFKDKILQVFSLQNGLLSIGREPSCDIHIDSLAVEPQHARVVTRDNLCTISQCNSDTPTFVNHKPIDEYVLAHNDIIRIGKHTLRYLDGVQASSDHKDPVEPIMPDVKTGKHFPYPVDETKEKPATMIAGWLQVMSGKNLGRTFKLHSGLTDLGSLGMSPVLIALRHGGYFISNLTEDNSLSVADQEVGEKSHPLHDGDLIKIGKLTLQFHLHA